MEDSIETYIKRETKGGGDCAFHAALGAWDPRMKQFEADNVHEKRTRLADAIRNCQPNHNIYPLVKEAIRELLTRNLRGINALNLGMLKKNYEIFIKQNGDAIEQAWIVFEKELQKHDDIIAGIEKFTEDHKRQRELSLENVEKLQILEQKFKNYENENPEGLEAIIRVETKLNEAYQTYKQSLQVLMKSNEDGCERWFESQISKDVLDEYAQYVSRQGEWLLPCELQIIAYVFNIHIRYYTGASANVEEFNPHGEKIIYVRFNGDSHYERMAGDAEIAKANSLSKVVGSLSEEVQESPPVQPADSKISIRDLLLIQLDCTPFRSYQDAVDCYRQAKGTEEGLQVRERLLNLPQYIVHNYCASELKELVHLVSCEDEDITRAVINSLWPLLDMADARYVYGAVLALIRQLQTTGQKCDDACLVDLLGKLLDRLGQELRNLSALDSNNALLALQATASLVDCLYEQGILLGKDFLKPCRDLSLEFVRSFSIAARVSHPLHAFWSNYLQRGLAASEMRLTPYQIQVIQAQRRKALWSTAGHAGEGVLRVALGTGGLAWGILLAATGFAIHGLPDAGVAFAVSLIDCVKCLHKANKSYARVKEADQDLNPRAGVQPATAAQEALGVKENDTDEIKFWQGLQEKVIPIITQARTEPFEVQMLAYTLTGLLKKAGPNRSPEAQEAAETCMKSVQSFFKEAYMQAIHEPTTQRFIMACCEQLHKAGFDFPEWEVGQYANFFLGIHDELENDKPNGPNKRYAQWKIYQAKKMEGKG